MTWFLLIGYLFTKFTKKKKKFWAKNPLNSSKISSTCLQYTAFMRCSLYYTVLLSTVSHCTSLFTTHTHTQYSSSLTIFFFSFLATLVTVPFPYFHFTFSKVWRNMTTPDNWKNLMPSENFQRLYQPRRISQSFYLFQIFPLLCLFIIPLSAVFLLITH